MKDSLLESLKEKYTELSLVQLKSESASLLLSMWFFHYTLFVLAFGFDCEPSYFVLFMMSQFMPCSLSLSLSLSLCVCVCVCVFMEPSFVLSRCSIFRQHAVKMSHL